MRQIDPRRYETRQDRLHRLQYSVSRRMLSKRFVALLKYGVPSLVLAAGLGIYLASEDRRQKAADHVTVVRDYFANRPEFRVDMMKVTGASEDVHEDILEVIPIDFPTSSFDLDLKAIKAEVENLSPVKKATVRVAQGVMVVEILEREPAVLWRTADGLLVLDADGKFVREASERAEFGDLLVMVGDGADVAVKEALSLYANSGALKADIRGFRRMGARRWDIELRSGQIIRLPSLSPEIALDKALALVKAADLLERDVVVLDLRLPERTTVQIGQLTQEKLEKYKQVSMDGRE